MKTLILVSATWLWGVSLVLGAASCGNTTNGTDGGGKRDLLSGAAPDLQVGLAINGCTATSYVDDSAAGANRAISFGGLNGSGSYSYSPQCMTIAAGQTVTFSGDFSMHPLSPGSSFTDLNSGSPNNPIPSSPPGPSTAMVTFPTAGIYPYFCQNHYAFGMLGVVQVH